MKRVISALAVIAIVSGALAFKAPLNTKFCASTTQNVGCAIILKKTANGANNFFYKADFDGINCPITDCPTAIRLVDEN